MIRRFIISGISSTKWILGRFVLYDSVRPVLRAWRTRPSIPAITMIAGLSTLGFLLFSFAYCWWNHRHMQRACFSHTTIISTSA